MEINIKHESDESISAVAAPPDTKEPLQPSFHNFGNGTVRVTVPAESFRQTAPVFPLYLIGPKLEDSCYRDFSEGDVDEYNKTNNDTVCLESIKSGDEMISLVHKPGKLLKDTVVNSNATALNLDKKGDSSSYEVKCDSSSYEGKMTGDCIASNGLRNDGERGIFVKEDTAINMESKVTQQQSTVKTEQTPVNISYSNTSHSASQTYSMSNALVNLTKALPNVMKNRHILEPETTVNRYSSALLATNCKKPMPERHTFLLVERSKLPAPTVVDKRINLNAVENCNTQTEIDNSIINMEKVSEEENDKKENESESKTSVSTPCDSHLKVARFKGRFISKGKQNRIFSMKKFWFKKKTEEKDVRVENDITLEMSTDSSYDLRPLMKKQKKINVSAFNNSSDDINTDPDFVPRAHLYVKPSAADSRGCSVCSGIHCKLKCDNDHPIGHIHDLYIDTCLNTSIKSVASLPHQLLLGRSRCNENEMGIFCEEAISKGTQLGPVVGEKISFKDLSPDMDFRHIWYAAKDDEWKELEFVSTKNESESNWCRYLQPSVDKDCNVVCLMRGANLFFMTRRDICVGEELVYYIRSFDVFEWRGPLNLYTLGGQSEEGTYCKPCQLHFPEAMNYLKHYQIYHTLKGGHIRSICSVCEMEFLSRLELYKHTKIYHNGVGGGCICKKCGKGFVFRNQLNTHMESHGDPVTCKLCDKRYSNARRLKQHVLRFHSEKRFECSSCDKIFRCQANMVRHSKTHSDTYPITCDWCGKQFRNTTNLRVHLLTHSGIKPFKCAENDCSASFTVKQCLQVHYRKQHGYCDENMPEIKRSVPFTTDAYMGQDQVDDTVSG